MQSILTECEAKFQHRSDEYNATCFTETQYQSLLIQYRFKNGRYYILYKDALRDCKYTEYKEPILTNRPLPTGRRTRSVKGNKIKYKPSFQATNQTSLYYLICGTRELLQIIGC
eukprot:790275_1